MVGRGWVGADPTTTLAGLRGRFVLLDFWTFCCVNCLHVLDELRGLEERWADVLTVVGVHSPKFPHEAERGAVEAAVARYGVTHPVIDDADMATWRAYAARAWPTLVLIDPEGFIAAQYAGEGHAHAIDALLGDLVPRAEAAGTLVRDGAPPPPPAPATSGLRFPSGLLDLDDGRLLVSDTANHQLVLIDGTSDAELARWGTGTRGLVDGPASTASFDEPQGLCLLPSAVAADAGFDVVVADTVNHAVRGVRLRDGYVTTLAGTGSAWSPLVPTSLSSPWDVEWWDGTVWVAMAGIHQLWTLDPLTSRTQPVAGTRTEGLRDGPLDQAWFAQPSALAAGGDRLWLVDAETSALRWVADGEVRTAVGEGLFEFGFVDGPASEARLQHPLGVAVLDDGVVVVSDTYNGAVRRYDPATREVATLTTGLAEPSHLVLAGDHLLVLESAAHRVVAVPLDARDRATGRTTPAQRPPTPLSAGAVQLVIDFSPPPGQRMDVRYGPATRVTVTATPASLLTAGAGTTSQLTREIRLDPAAGGGVLHVTASAASCDDTAPDDVGSACHLHQQDWGIPVTVVEDADDELRLVLGGTTS